MARLSDYYKSERDRVKHDVKVYEMSAAQEMEEWSRLLEKFRYEANAVMDINKQVADSAKRMWKETEDAQKFALEMGYIGEEEYFSWLASYRDMNYKKWGEEYNKATLELKKYTDSFYDDALEKLDGYEKEFDTWISHSVKMGELNSDEQIHAYRRFADNYNAMVSEIVVTTQMGADEVNELWNKAYEIRRYSEEQVYAISGGKYDKWQSDMENWIKMHDTFDDWESIGDSLYEVYSRAIERQREFYENGTIGYQEFMDNTFDYSLKRYSAASDHYDEILSQYRMQMDEIRDELAGNEAALRLSWTVSDRERDTKELDGLIAIYKNAATDKGQEKYKELLEERERLRRDEELYQLELKNNAVIEEMEKEYEQLEANKKRVLSSLKTTTGDISLDVGEVKEIADRIGIDTASASESVIGKLDAIYTMLDRIRSVSGSTNTYNDNKNVTIAGGVSESCVSRLINGTIVSGLSSVMFNG